ncbi:hypothetical protein OS175_07225 [Marinicella sp. S1101]|nr:hypothetical protein [Marinicella marina]MCX7553665.1 hypothetical protein [Marinicella marina]MDJ1140289.1 hypothetical protein [Marinicella marina]
MIFLLITTIALKAGDGVLTFEDHGYINPFTGGVAWETTQNQAVLAMEWDFIGMSEVLPLCSGDFDWTVVDEFLTRVDARGHQAILRPILFGPGYGQESYAPADMIVNDFFYEGSLFDNPEWSDASVQACVLKFIDGFALRYSNDQRIAYVQMGLAGLWGEHHLDGAAYTSANFPSYELQKTMITHYITGFGATSADIQTSLSLDAAQAHGFFSQGDESLDDWRFGFFDDSLLINDHNSVNNWRQDPTPAAQLLLHRQHGWGGEAYWTGCNSTGTWAQAPFDCGNGESLNDQAIRIGLNYMLGSPAFTNDNISANSLLNASQMMGYKFTATAASRLNSNQITVTIENTGAAYSPYQIQVCTEQGCAGDLSTLAPASEVNIILPATAADTQVLRLISPRLDPSSSQKIRWSNTGADEVNATLTVLLNDSDMIFSDGFDIN